MIKKFSNKGRTLTVLTFILLGFGLMMLASAGVVEGQKKFGDSYYFFKHQLLFGVLPGLAMLFLMVAVKYEFWRKTALFVLLGAVGFTVAVFVPGIGQTLRGVQRWLALGPVTLQPSEFLKLGIIIYLAALFSRREKRVRDWSYSLVPFIFVMGFVFLILAKQPDVGTLAVLVVISMAMFFFSNARWKHIITILLITGLVLGLLVWLSPYRLNRVITFLNPQLDIRGIAYHINQALIGIGAGGVWGLGLGQSQQKQSFLPEPVGDSVFAVLVEEIGFVGGATLIGLFMFLGVVLISISKNANDSFGQLLAAGIAVWVVGQAFINISGIVGLIPLTGIPLPFISFGSSALVATMAGLGIAINVANRN